MRSQFAVVVFCIALAGRASALFLEMDPPIGNISASAVLNVADPALSACQTRCSPASTAIANCNSNNQCLCSTATVTQLVACEQCMFEQLIARNARNTDPKVGSAPVLGAYAAACTKAKFPVAPTAVRLTLPPNWDGPASLPLSTGVTVLALCFGAFFGISAILLLSNL